MKAIIGAISVAALLVAQGCASTGGISPKSGARTTGWELGLPRRVIGWFVDGQWASTGWISKTNPGLAFIQSDNVIKGAERDMGHAREHVDDIASEWWRKRYAEKILTLELAIGEAAAQREILRTEGIRTGGARTPVWEIELQKLSYLLTRMEYAAMRTRWR